MAQIIRDTESNKSARKFRVPRRVDRICGTQCLQAVVVGQQTVQLVWMHQHINENSILSSLSQREHQIIRFQSEGTAPTGRIR